MKRANYDLITIYAGASGTPVTIPAQFVLWVPGVGPVQMQQQTLGTQNES